MSNVYFTSDWHLGHKNVERFRTKFSSEEEHSNFIISNYFKTIKKRDVVWFLGDIIFDKRYLLAVKCLPGTKYLVLGNHDTDRGISLKELITLEVFDKIVSLYKYKGFWLSHAPIHPCELRGKRNIHGHSHFQKVFSEQGYEDSRYINVCLEHTNYFPIRFDTIKI